MKRPHDTQIGEQLLRRNLDQLEIITADKATTGTNYATNYVKKA
jgi:hypothetical protein